METIHLPITREPGTEDLPLPKYQSTHASGMDLHAAVDEPLELAPGAIALIPTGLRIAVPPGFEAQIRPRSGLALKHGITVMNTPGTIDADYRGEVKVILGNLGPELFVINRGERICQMVLAPVVQAKLEVVAELDTTARGDGGFGHTGR